MNKGSDIIEELNNMGSSLAGISHVMPYSVPYGYFNLLPDETMKMVSVFNQEDPAPHWSKTVSYTIPEGYFESLTDNIITAVKTDHIKSVSSKDIPLNVPAGFFESFPDKVLHAAKKSTPVKKQATHIPLGRNSFGQIRWATAAVLLICIGFGGYETFSVQPDNTEKMLSSVPNNDIKDYLQQTYTFDVNRIVDNNDINNLQVDNKDIIQYLNETGWDMTE